MSDDLTFIGKNIRFLRRSKNMTLVQLASRIGIREGPLGRIERGANLPSAAVIYKLTKALGVSADALFSGEAVPAGAAAGDGAFFVTLDPAPAPPPRAAVAPCRDIMAAFHALEDICGVQKHAFVPLSVSFKPDYSGMDRLAHQIRNYMGAGDAVVFDYFELFENHGLRIILFPFQRAAADLEAVSFYEPASHNAFFFLNSRKNAEKQLFALLTELGKILISNQMRLTNAALFPKGENTERNSRAITPDRAAKRFAATFLMPEQAVKTTVGQLGIAPDRWSFDLLLRIKHRFGISAESFLYRLDELGLISNALIPHFQKEINAFYTQTGFGEPDASRRCLTPNGRFFDLLLTAGTFGAARQEMILIEKMVKELKLVKI